MSIPSIDPIKDLPGVRVSVPPLEYLGSISRAIDEFKAASLKGKSGGLLVVTTINQQGAVNANLAIVRKNDDFIFWIGKEGSWGEPWAGGFAWRHTWD